MLEGESYRTKKDIVYKLPKKLTIAPKNVYEKNQNPREENVIF